MDSTRAFIVRGRQCPCDCEGNGVLVYLACPDCDRIVLVCDEIGNVFDNLDDPLASSPLVMWRSASQRCPGCQQVLLADFHPATEQALARVGIEPECIDINESAWRAIRRTANC